MILRLISILLACASIEAFAPSTGCRSATSLHSTLPSAPSIKLDRQDADCKSATSLHSTVPSSPTFKLDPQDAWIEQLDYAGFAKEVTALGKELQKNTGQADVDHLNKIVSWRNIAAAIGVSTMWMPPNPLTIIALSTWTYASWTMIAHHACHGGYNRVDAGKFNSRGFALGSVKKRIEDWCDWMMPEAWNVEHNRLHHYHLGEDLDPDLVERNLSFLREMDIPKPLKYGVALALMSIWKSYYYAPNTFKELQITKWRQEGRELPTNFDPNEPVTLRMLFFPKDDGDEAIAEVINPTKFMLQVMAPFLLTRFIFLPAPLLLFPGLEPTLFSHAVVNLVLAEMLTNIHGFITIVTNHAGSDLYKFRDEVQPKSGSFYVRQVVSSANYNGGSDLLDFSQGWLNYQIEHHVWPDLSMKQYQLGAPKLEEICQKYGVPYVKENVFVRLAKTLNIMVGQSSMREFPTEMEPQKDKARKGVTWKSTNGAIDEPE